MASCAMVSPSWLLGMAALAIQQQSLTVPGAYWVAVKEFKLDDHNRDM